MDNNSTILNIIKKSSKNLSAYQILDKFQKIKKVHPTTVYRSLEFLINRGIIHKSNINKTYVMCRHSGQHKHDQNTLLDICKKCGKTEELLKKIFLPITKMSKLKKFDLSYFDIEILTMCKSCK